MVVGDHLSPFPKTFAAQEELAGAYPAAQWNGRTANWESCSELRAQLLIELAPC